MKFFHLIDARPRRGETAVDDCSGYFLVVEEKRRVEISQAYPPLDNSLYLLGEATTKILPRRSQMTASWGSQAAKRASFTLHRLAYICTPEGLMVSTR